MNVKEAKEQIENAITAYFTKNEFGKYEISIEKQRPVFLMGPPGIGKTAIMEQIASEMGVGLLSYSMTHHTRQSALGLPFIEHKNFQGNEFDVSEYTMSEIIASVYELMENTGVREGILFLDEINCVSETLAPIMLQFLQYKVFGRHRVPDGWIVVTAGNPPEFNNSVREFDIVTWDRLKRIDVEPDFDTWKDYAYKVGVHPAVLTYLEIKKINFYKIESTVDGKSFVTARGWDDLSKIILLYEKNDILVDEKLIAQYLQNKKISRDFAVYYDLFKKYQSDYHVDEILKGKADVELIKRVEKAKFDERIAVLGLLLDAITQEIRGALSDITMIRMMMEVIKTFRVKNAINKDTIGIMDELISEKETMLNKGLMAGTISKEDENVWQRLILAMREQREILEADDKGKGFDLLKENYEKRVKLIRKTLANKQNIINNAYVFLEQSVGDGQEMLVFTTELTINRYTSKYISDFGCQKYFEHNKDILISERQKNIEMMITELEL